MCYPFKKLNAITCKKSKTSNKEIPIKITKEAHRQTTKQTNMQTHKQTYIYNFTGSHALHGSN